MSLARELLELSESLGIKPRTQTKILENGNYYVWSEKLNDVVSGPYDTKEEASENLVENNEVVSGSEITTVEEIEFTPRTDEELAEDDGFDEDDLTILSLESITLDKNSVSVIDNWDGTVTLKIGEGLAGGKPIKWVKKWVKGKWQKVKDCEPGFEKFKGKCYPRKDLEAMRDRKKSKKVRRHKMSAAGKASIAKYHRATSG